MHVKSGNKKVQATLGELYRRMSADFRAVRPADHRACVMPMVVRSRNPESEANWSVEALTSFCPFCTALTGMIAAEYSHHYEVKFFPEEQPDSELEPLPTGYYCAGV
jgi:hypothetical protein